MEEFYLRHIATDYTQWPMLIKVSVVATICMVFIGILLFAYILISRLTDQLQDSRKQWMEKKTQQLILSFLFNEQEWEEQTLQLIKRKYVSNTFSRNIFLKTLLALDKDLEGATADKLKLLYKRLQLDHYSYRKLYDTSWQVVAEGIIELSQMEAREYKELVRSYMNHELEVMRLVAHVALINLEPANPFAFLDDLKTPLSEWQQLRIIEATHHLEKTKLPDFRRWLDKEEESTVTFCIRMIAQFNQFDAASEVLSLLEHPSAAIRKESVIAIRFLELYQAEDKLRELFPMEAVETRDEISKTLRAIASDTHLPVIKEKTEAVASESKGRQVMAQPFGWSSLALRPGI